MRFSLCFAPPPCGTFFCLPSGKQKILSWLQTRILAGIFGFALCRILAADIQTPCTAFVRGFFFLKNFKSYFFPQINLVY